MIEQRPANSNVFGIRLSVAAINDQNSWLSMENPKETSEKRSIPRWIVAGFVTASFISMILGLSLVLSRHLFISELLNNFRLQIGITVVSFAIPLFWLNWRRLGMFQLLFGLIVLFPILSNIFANEQPPAGRQEYSLLSYNVLADNRNKAPVVELLKSTDVDVTVVVEYANDWVEQLKPLDQKYPYSLEAPRWHGFGIAIFSRHELYNKKIKMLSDAQSDIPFLLAEVALGDQKIILAAGHLLAPLQPYRMEIRNKQIMAATRLIKEYRDGRDLPVILVGDFNAVPWSPFIQDLLKTTELRDSRQGYFYHGSWPNDNLLVRIPIDHAFVSRQVHIHRRQLLRCYASDHLPLQIDFSISSSKD